MRRLSSYLTVSFIVSALSAVLPAQTVTYQPYIQPGDNSAFGASDQFIVAWQTNESKPNAAAFKVEYGLTTSYGNSATLSGRVVNNYLASDPALPIPASATGPRVNYTALAGGLSFGTKYFYRVTGPGMPSGGFTASTQTRKQGSSFSFLVEGDEGYFPVALGSPARITDFEARIVNAMFNVSTAPVTGLTNKLPAPDLALNTGDNVYNTGSEGTYRDYWMPVWNSNTASPDLGAPLIRSIPNYIVVGNHDTGGNGDFVNMLGGDGAGKFTGNTEGGDALAYYNNYYFPLNGPSGVDSSFVFNGDNFSQNGWFLSSGGKNYTSQAALDAFRNSTFVDAGQGPKQQIDHMSNYSFDYGNAHFLFLDSNPHLFNALVDFSPTYTAPPGKFPQYPSALRDWAIRDLDSTKQLWKFVVFHHPSFSSGNATVRNNQMRHIARMLEDHGVSMVFNGHEHNYQRTNPIRALARVAETPATGSQPAVAIDNSFDGNQVNVPDGVIYIVDGAGGNRDFDGGLPTPRGQGPGLDEDDSVSGVSPQIPYPQGAGAWLDTSLTNTEMVPFIAGAGSGPKITKFFKAKLFSFSDIVVENNVMTLYQITEPLTAASSATAATPAPYGVDYTGKAFNDPLPETQVDPATGQVTQLAGTGTSALMDKFSVAKPDVGATLAVTAIAPRSVVPGGQMAYEIQLQNNSPYNLNGVQIDLTLPAGATYDVNDDDPVTLQAPNDVVFTVGRLVRGESRKVTMTARAPDGLATGTSLTANLTVRSATAMPVSVPAVVNSIGALCASAAAPTLAAVTNGTYGPTISGTGPIVVWGQNFSATGGNYLIFKRPGFADISYSETSGLYYWDLANGQINASLGGRLAPGAWSVNVLSGCSATPSNALTVTIN